MSFMNCKSKLYIEFVGQHTAGKTTVIHDIVDRGLLEPVNAIYPQKIKRSRLDLVFCMPRLIFVHMIDILFLFQFFARNVKCNWMNYHSAGRHMWKMIFLHPYFSKFDYDVWMKDDLLHLLPRLEFKPGVDTSDAFNLFFNHFSHWYSGLVFIDLPYEDMKVRFNERFKNRPHQRRKNRSKVYERAYVQNKILKHVLLEQNKVRVLVLDGKSEVAMKSAQVVKFIKELLYEKK